MIRDIWLSIPDDIAFWLAIAAAFAAVVLAVWLLPVEEWLDRWERRSDDRWP